MSLAQAVDEKDFQELSTGKNEAEDVNSESFERSEFGAVRSTDADDIRYDLISHIGLRRLALRYALGAKKYGDFNWLKGFKALPLLKHLLKHLYMWIGGDRSDDHLAAVAWGIFTLMHFEETRPELINVPVKLEDVLKEENELRSQPS